MNTMTESFDAAGKSLLDLCLVDLSVYKRAVKTLDSQAVRRLIESIIAQKIDQVGDLRTITGSSADVHASDHVNEETDGTAAENWPDKESLLKTIIDRENAFAEASRALAAKAGSDEHRSALNTCAERSRKFASWSQDHLDLMGLF